MRSFNLIRYFAVASLAVIAVLALAIGWVFSRNLERSLTQEAGLYARDISKSLNRAIYLEYLLPQMAAGGSFDLADPAQRAALDAVVESRTRGLRILTVILFDTNGTIIYSTNPDYIGYRSIDNPGIAAALQEGASSFLKRAELELDPIRPGHDLLETYTPFYELDPSSNRTGEIVGVLEVYQDARPITQEIARGQREILLTTAALMGLLFLALFQIVRRGHLRITQLSDALEVSNRELENQVIQSASLANLGEMAAGVAHEIRNPIGMIQSSAQLLSNAPDMSERDRNLLEVIQAETSRVNRTITEFVGFASATEPSRKLTEPRVLLERVQMMLQPEAEHRKIVLALDVEEDLPRILVDQELVYRALTNLVLNAIQVQGEGGRVELRATRSEPGEVAFHILDHGPGIRDEDMEQIFKPFFTKRPGGTGLGLSIVQRIVTANSGRISVSSSPKGTEFTLCFAEVDA